MIRLIDAEKIYDNGTHALNGVSFTVDDGEFAFLVGPPAPASPPSSSC